MAESADHEYELWAAACERACERLRGAVDRREERLIFAGLGTDLQWLVALRGVDDQVRNGGFSQLYGNALGWMTPSAASGLRLLGMDEAAQILETAHEMGRLAYDDEGSCLDPAHVERLDALNNLYYSLPSECVVARVAEWLRSHRHGN